MKKTIWIIDPYSEIPEDGWRLGRYFLMAKKLSGSNYKVVIWLSSISHRSKDKSFLKNKLFEEIQYDENISIVVVNSSTYNEHISFARIKYEYLFSKNITLLYEKFIEPDIIILKDPAIFLFKPLKKIITKSKAKLIFDVIDLWPELFELILPNKIRWLGKVIFSPFYYFRINYYKYASGFIAVAPDYLKVAEKVNSNALKEVVYWGVPLKKILYILKNSNDNILNKYLLNKKEGDIWGIYAGTLGNNYDIKCLLEAAKLLEVSCPNLTIIIAGAGPLGVLVGEEIKNMKNVRFLGSIRTENLFQLFKFCDFGFSTYSEKSTVSMPIKIYDYLAAGLPIINSLNRNIRKVIEDYKVGLQYEAGNAQSLYNCISKLIADLEILKELSSNAKRLSYTFNEDLQYNKVVTIVDSILSLDNVQNIKKIH